MKRKPYVAGQFYPGNKESLLDTIREMIDTRAARKKAVAVVAPHAGYIYSGTVAGAVFSSVEIPPNVVIIGPGHREIESLFAVQTEGSWLTPLGEVPIQSVLAGHLLQKCALAAEDEKAHLWEHSLEVEVPFLQFFQKGLEIVPVCISYEAGFDDLVSLGNGVAEAIRTFGLPVLIVASTDMSHYVSQKTAEKKDGLAIRKILDLDPQGLYETVRSEGISMCGYQPVTAALFAAKELGAAGADLIKYQTSGERTGDYAQVVGYAGIRIY